MMNLLAGGMASELVSSPWLLLALVVLGAVSFFVIRFELTAMLRRRGWLNPDASHGELVWLFAEGGLGTAILFVSMVIAIQADHRLAKTSVAQGVSPQALSFLRRMGAVRIDDAHRVPAASGTFWFYSFDAIEHDSRDLNFCKEAVRIVPADVPEFDYAYTTSTDSTCGDDYHPWKGYLVWNAAERAFIDVSYDTGSNQLLYGYLRLPGWADLNTVDAAVGFEVGSGDYTDDQPMSGLYLLSARVLSESQVLRIMNREVESRVTFPTHDPARTEADCQLRPAKYGRVAVSELIACDSSEPTASYLTMPRP